MAQRVQFRRGTSAEWAASNPVLAQGEIGIELDTEKFKIGNGIDPWAARPYGGIKGDRGIAGPTGPAGLTPGGAPGVETVTPESFAPNAITTALGRSFEVSPTQNGAATGGVTDARLAIQNTIASLEADTRPSFVGASVGIDGTGKVYGVSAPINIVRNAFNSLKNSLLRAIGAAWSTGNYMLVVSGASSYANMGFKVSSSLECEKKARGIYVDTAYRFETTEEFRANKFKEVGLYLASSVGLAKVRGTLHEFEETDADFTNPSAREATGIWLSKNAGDVDVDANVGWSKRGLFSQADGPVRVRGHFYGSSTTVAIPGTAVEKDGNGPMVIAHSYLDTAWAVYRSGFFGLGDTNLLYRLESVTPASQTHYIDAVAKQDGQYHFMLLRGAYRSNRSIPLVRKTEPNGIRSVTVNVGGTGYSNNTTITANVASATRLPILRVTVAAGVITGVVVDDGGQDVVGPVTFTLSNTGGGAGASFTAVLGTLRWANIPAEFSDASYDIWTSIDPVLYAPATTASNVWVYRSNSGAGCFTQWRDNNTTFGPQAGSNGDNYQIYTVGVKAVDIDTSQNVAFGGAILSYGAGWIVNATRGSNAAVVAKSSSGNAEVALISGSSGTAQVGSVTNTPLQIIRNNAEVARYDTDGPHVRLAATATPLANGELVIQATSNTSLTFKYKGSDGAVRTASLTLA